MPSVTLPLPPITLKPNRTMGQGWRAVSKAKREYQEACALAVTVQRSAWANWPPFYPTRLRLVAYLDKGRFGDSPDVGGWAKSGLDSLVQCGVWPDDRQKYLNPTESWIVIDDGEERLVVQWGQDAERPMPMLPGERAVPVRVTNNRRGDDAT